VAAFLEGQVQVARLGGEEAGLGRLGVQDGAGVQVALVG